MLDRVFDNYMMTPMQKVVLDALRLVADRDRYGVVEARELLDQIYPGSISSWKDATGLPAQISRWPIAPPPPRSSTPTGPTRSPLAMAACVPIVPGCLAIPPSCGWWRRQGHFDTISRWARRRVTEWDGLWWAGHCRSGQCARRTGANRRGKTEIFIQMIEYAFMTDISPSNF